MIAVLGAGAHGRQIAALTLDRGHINVLYDDYLEGYGPCDEGARADQWVVGAVWPNVRRRIAERQFRAKRPWTWNDGQIIFPGAQIGIEVDFGLHVHVGFNAVVNHGCRLGDYVTVAPGAVLSGEVTVEHDAFIGANATVIHGGITIGPGAYVGAGAVVLNDVPPGAVVAGVPARQLERS